MYLSCIQEDLNAFDRYFEKHIGLEFVQDKFDFSFVKRGKKIRPSLVFLCARALGTSVDENIMKLAFAVEMIHNATLAHDDIIDNAKVRRGVETINAKYDSKLAVLTGDFFLSKALEALSELNSSQVIKIHADSISKLIKGEFEQYFDFEKAGSIEKYLEKSRNKTAELFRAALCSVTVIADKTQFMDEIEKFALNFGTAFQIANDLKDVNEDIKNGTYTAPLIYYFEEKGYNKKVSQKDVENSSAVEKTLGLIDEYITRAIENINFLEDNQNKRAIINLCKSLKRTP